MTLIQAAELLGQPQQGENEMYELTEGQRVVVKTVMGETIEATFVRMEDVSGVVVGLGGSPMPKGSTAYRFTRLDGRSSKAGFRRYPHEIVSIEPLA